jgi:hypothetical protein
MKVCKILFIASLFLFSIMHQASAQDKAIGIRGGITPGLNYKSYQSYNTAYEFILGNKDGGNLITALFEFHEAASALLRERFRYYYGFGCHLGYYKEEYTYMLIDNEGEEYEETEKKTYLL